MAPCASDGRHETPREMVDVADALLPTAEATGLHVMAILLVAFNDSILQSAPLLCGSRWFIYGEGEKKERILDLLKAG